MLAVLLIALALAAVGLARRFASPLRAGVTADDVWNYARTGGVCGFSVPNAAGLSTGNRWRADATNIYWERLYLWHTNKSFAARQTVYFYGTNDTIQNVRSKWTFSWPF